ncbi:MAG: Flp family type IVb pilin [Pseudobdellovibrionaceae bacterium]
MFIKLLAMTNAYLTKEDGATAIEYGLIAAGIALAISVAVVTFGENLTSLFETASSKLQAASE